MGIWTKEHSRTEYKKRNGRKRRDKAVHGTFKPAEHG